MITTDPLEWAQCDCFCMAQVDLDLGNYERFMDLTLHKDNNITTGKVYQVSSQYLDLFLRL